jgi:hypothetical protein
LYSTTTYFASATENGCQGLRSAVVANLVSPSPLTVTAGQTVCNNATVALNVTSTVSNYDSYSWSPSANLFTDAEATIAYIAGSNASTVYAKTSAAGATTYTVSASNSESGCTNTASSIVTVLPGNFTASANPTSICKSGSALISLSPSNGYGNGSVQWQSSSDNASFTDISGATNTSYTTPVLSATTYYQAVINDEAGNTCSTVSFTMAVNNPQVSAVNGGVRCGVGALSLSATAETGTVKWYSSLTSTSVLATAANYTTPVISTTKTYYVGLTLNNC